MPARVLGDEALDDGVGRLPVGGIEDLDAAGFAGLVRLFALAVENHDGADAAGILVLREDFDEFVGSPGTELEFAL